ncbi:MAG: hydantoinase/oxoprolinase family protein, partial [Gemmatimonadota bacterium]
TLLARCEALPAARLEAAFEALEERARESFAAEGHAPRTLRLERALDMRYVGQGYELAVPFGPGFERAFHDAHERRYGYADPGRAAEIVNVRLRATAPVEPPRLAGPEPAAEEAPRAALLGSHRFVWDGEEREGVLIDRGRLRAGHAFDGPAIVVEYSTTTVVPPDARCRVDRCGNLALEWT